MKRFCLVCCAAICCLALAAGCSKKVTKIEPTPEPAPAPVVEPAPAPEPEPEPAPQVDEALQILIPIYFDYDKSNLRSDALATLESIGPFLQRNPAMRIMIEGHADERGTDEYNIGLGENRAKSARQWLTKYGIDKGRIEIVSYGKSRPADMNCGEDDACHAKNRRVEWKVLSR
jgi:peptidoglycan-associated lipoprotein